MNMSLEDSIIYLQVSISGFLINKWGITPGKFVDLDQKYRILWYIRLCYQPFHLTGDEGIAEDIEKFIEEQGGAVC